MPGKFGYAPIYFEKMKNARFGDIDGNALVIEVAETIIDIVPNAEMIKFYKSGGEADAIVVRIARGYSGKEKELFLI